MVLVLCLFKMKNKCHGVLIVYNASPPRAPFLCVCVCVCDISGARRGAAAGQPKHDEVGVAQRLCIVDGLRESVLGVFQASFRLLWLTGCS